MDLTAAYCALFWYTFGLSISFCIALASSLTAGLPFAFITIVIPFAICSPLRKSIVEICGHSFIAFIIVAFELMPK